MLRQRLRDGLRQVHTALRQPEVFALDWHRGQSPASAWTCAALLATAVLGTAAYGMTMGLGGGAPRVLRSGLGLVVAAGLAWGIPLPGLYVLNSLSGSRLSAATTLLSALVTVSWGALAMVASIPIHWFLASAWPEPRFVLAVNLTVFAGVGIAMVDVFGRVLRALEPGRGRGPSWLLVPVALIGTELFHAFGLFRFATLQ